jgi:hypothetical protein
MRLGALSFSLRNQLIPRDIYQLLVPEESAAPGFDLGFRPQYPLRASRPYRHRGADHIAAGVWTHAVRHHRVRLQRRTLIQT